ncbi:hypothetical protein NDU88_008440 [Pleurodeles waltl]|uniref:Uncharacterized protein n=1 Tax=Pleurodeles waltl TaxID=8319 RepID=A0AAV7RVS4_PLEWA|nr:hypothetical protein NDU88_008440 [Pleurodeles waltl]
MNTGCDIASGLSGLEEQDLIQQQDNRTVQLDLRVRVGASLKSRLEGRPKLEAICLTLWECAGATQEEPDTEIFITQPSTSRGAESLWCYAGLDEEILDFEDEREDEEGEIVDEIVSSNLKNTVFGSGSLSNERRSHGVLQKVIPRMV